MRFAGIGIALACAAGAVCWAARCTTVAPPAVLREYANYVATAEPEMDHRFDSGELAWMPKDEARQAAARLASGLLVRWNVSDAAVNQRLSAQNGTVIHWIGAIRISAVSLADVKAVLEDYDHYARIYDQLISDCKAVRNGESTSLILGLHSTFRLASVFPQHYAFQAKARMDLASSAGSSLAIHMAVNEIRESDSGVPGRTDFLEPYHDHGILWALNTYWRARQEGPNVYLEFETITLARSVEEFSCKIGFIPIPKSVVASAMDSLPADCVTVILEGTRSECERRAMHTRSSQ